MQAKGGSGVQNCRTIKEGRGLVYNVHTHTHTHKHTHAKTLQSKGHMPKVDQNHIHYAYDTLADFIKYMVVYGVYTRFWPTLYMPHHCKRACEKHT